MKIEFRKMEGQLGQRAVLDKHHLAPSVQRKDRIVERPRGKTPAEKHDELKSLFALQEECNRALGKEFDPEDMLKRSHNPVIDRWHVESLRLKGDFEGLEAHRMSMREDMRKNLMERLHTVESYGEYKINGSELVSKDFIGQSFYEVLERGVEYRKELGSTEQEREGELGELAGWKKINAFLANPNTPLGVTMQSLSPHGLVKDTAYNGWFVDTFTLRENFKKEKYVERIRTGVNWDYPQYADAALKMDPHYFDNLDERPLDAWFLANPLVGKLDLSKKGFSVIDTDRILRNPRLKRYLQNYEDQIFAEKADWLEIAIAFNAPLNYLDELKENLQNGDRFKMRYEADLDEVAFRHSVRSLGTRQVKTVGGGGCPSNKGIDLGGMFGSSGYNSGLDINSNSVAKFGLESLLDEEGDCKCQDKSDNHYHCPKKDGGCGKKYADETNVSPEDRTKECGCGFKFGC